ncbi:hypothetical protein [Priestia flexa]|uniref:hypothetical protein n=1 Tax=Priestia flexa TaxID=86664 RepID=UPI00288D6959|nr:hypothetical protein [Priestia flexa]MDT2048033.1 hypothetical protein [Priestia flexa]
MEYQNPNNSERKFIHTENEILNNSLIEAKKYSKEVKKLAMDKKLSMFLLKSFYAQLNRTYRYEKE